MLYISHLLPDTEMEEVLAQTGAGLECIEFSIADNLDCLAKKVREYEKRLQRMKPKGLALHGPFLDLNPAAYDMEIRKATAKRYDQAYTAARALGADKIVFHSCFYPQIYFLEGWAERVIDFYQEFLETHQEIEIVMENVLMPVWMPIAEIAEKLTYPNFGLCLDVGHANCYSKIPVDIWCEKLLPYLRHIHLHDNDGLRDAHAALGSGTIPLEKLQKQLLGKEVSYTIECNTKQDVMKSYALL